MKKLFIPAFLTLLLVPIIAFAADFRAGEEIFVTETVNDDLYIGGGMVQVDSDVNGDLTIGAGKVTVNAKISQDLNIGGGDVFINGEVGDDLRVGGGNIRINAIIKDDVMVGGGDTELSRDSFVGGDLTVGSGNLTLLGTVNGDVFAGVGAVMIDGEVKGNVNFANVDQIKFGPSGRILGNLTYRSQEPIADLAEGVVGGEVTYKPTEYPVSEDDMKGFLAALFAGISIYKLLSLLFAGLFLVWLFHFYCLGTVAYGHDNLLKSLGVGLLVFILTPILALLLAVTIIGLPLAGITMLMWLVVLFVGKLFASLMIGGKIVKVNNKSGFGRLYASFVVGALIYTLLAFVPIVGWVLRAFLVLISIGALSLYEKGLFDHLRTKKMI